MAQRPNPGELVRQQQLQEHDRWPHAHAEMREEHEEPISQRLRAVELRMAAMGGGLAVVGIAAGAALGEVLHRTGILP